MLIDLRTEPIKLEYFLTFLNTQDRLFNIKKPRNTVPSFLGQTESMKIHRDRSHHILLFCRGIELKFTIFVTAKVLRVFSAATLRIFLYRLKDKPDVFQL